MPPKSRGEGDTGRAGATRENSPLIAGGEPPPSRTRTRAWVVSAFGTSHACAPFDAGTDAATGNHEPASEVRYSIATFVTPRLCHSTLYVCPNCHVAPVDGAMTSTWVALDPLPERDTLTGAPASFPSPRLAPSPSAR